MMLTYLLQHSDDNFMDKLLSHEFNRVTLNIPLFSSIHLAV